MKNSKLIEIKKAKKVIFVGDTHGDLEASQKVIKDYLLAHRSLPVRRSFNGGGDKVER